MFRRVAFAAGVLLCAQIGSAVAGEDTPQLTPEDFQRLLVVVPPAPMEKCFGLPDVKTMECNADPDSDECTASKKKPKDGKEFKYVPRDTCVSQGGQTVMAKHPKPQK
jgi:uncharacterized membrane protein